MRDAGSQHGLDERETDVLGQRRKERATAAEEYRPLVVRVVCGAVPPLVVIGR